MSVYTLRFSFENFHWHISNFQKYVQLYFDSCSTPCSSILPICILKDGYSTNNEATQNEIISLTITVQWNSSITATPFTEVWWPLLTSVRSSGVAEKCQQTHVCGEVKVVFKINTKSAPWSFRPTKSELTCKIGHMSDIYHHVYHLDHYEVLFHN